jgi:acetoin utilization deacetylase AcuC-like enzyme
VTTALITHSACLYHDVPLGHPESPDRLRAVLHALEAPRFAALRREEAPAVSEEALLRAHPKAFVERVLASIPREGFAQVDADTVLSPGTREAALRAAGAVTRAVDLVVTGEVTNAFCAVRPPGHHAEPATAMGFCLFNNVAIGAFHACAAHGLRRVAVMDFDVHHGNGTQAMFESDENLFYASTHQYPLYPGTGSAAETGIAENVVNVPLKPYSGSAEFRAGMSEIVLPRLDHFAPDLLLVSAGFDAHANDPLAQLNLADEDYAWASAALCDMARQHAKGRLVSALEGGYDLAALARSAAAHVGALMEA